MSSSLQFFSQYLQKFNQRKAKQLPEEAERYPLIFEMMSSEDEDAVYHRVYVTESARRHIKEVGL